MISNIRYISVTIFNYFVKVPLFSYVARKCRTDEEMTMVLNKNMYLFANDDEYHSEYINILDHCISYNYGESIKILITRTCPIFIKRVYAEVESDYLYSLMKILSTDELIQLYMCNEGKGFFTTETYWLLYAITRKDKQLIKFLLEKGHYLLNKTWRYDDELYYDIIDSSYGNSNTTTLFIEHKLSLLFSDSLRWHFIKAMI